MIFFYLQPLPDEAFEELIPVEYDIPKIRDSLSTIEEEHQEYDVPRNCIIKQTGNDFEDIGIVHHMISRISNQRIYKEISRKFFVLFF